MVFFPQPMRPLGCFLWSLEVGGLLETKPSGSCNLLFFSGALLGVHPFWLRVHCDWLGVGEAERIQTYYESV